MAAILALLISAPLVLATDRFVDVQAEPFHHDDINILANSGITVGCGTDPETALPIYCPNNAVTRAQMASFLVRGLGRASDGATPPDEQDLALPTAAAGRAVASATVTVPGAALSTTPVNGYVLVTAAATGASLDDCASHCLVTVWLTDGATQSFFMTESVGPSGSDVAASLGATWIFDVSALPGTQKTFELRGRHVSGAGTTNMFGSITALWIPFKAEAGQ